MTECSKPPSLSSQAISPTARALANPDIAAQILKYTSKSWAALRGVNHSVQAAVESQQVAVALLGSKVPDPASALLNGLRQSQQLAAGRCKRTDLRQGYLHPSVAFDRSGFTRAFGGYHAPASVYKAGSVAPDQAQILKTGSAYSMALSLDGYKFAASEAYDDGIRIWDLQNVPPTATLLANRYCGSMAFSPDGNSLAVNNVDDTLSCWNLRQTPPTETVLQHAQGKGAAFSPDGRWLAGTGYHADVRLWDVSNGAPRQVLGGGAANIALLMASFSPNGQFLACATQTGTNIRVWDLGVTPPSLKTLEGTPSVWSRPSLGGIVHLGFSPDNLTLATVQDGCIGFWDLSKDVPPVKWLFNPSSLLPWLRGSAFLSFAFSPDGRTLATGARDGSVALWELTQWPPRRIMRQPTRCESWYHGIAEVAFSPQGDALVSSGEFLTLWSGKG